MEKNIKQPKTYFAYYKWKPAKDNFYNVQKFIETLFKSQYDISISEIKRVNIKHGYFTRIKYFKIKIARTRQQVTYNANYGNSLRAIGFNHLFSEQELEGALIEFLNSNPMLLHFGFKTVGYEDEEIDNSEDKGLNQEEINLQLNDEDVSLMDLNRK